MQSSKFKVQNQKLIFNRGLPRRLAPPTRGRRPQEEVRALWGQSLFEVVFALAIAGIILVGIVSLATSAIRNTSFSRNQTVSTRYVQEAVEWLRGERDLDWGNFQVRASGGGSVWCLSVSPIASWPPPGSCGPGIAGTIFTREVTLTLTTTSEPNDTVQADVTVSWQDSQGLHDTRSVTRFTAWPTQ